VRGRKIPNQRLVNMTRATVLRTFRQTHSWPRFLGT
jgi:hypothetical protein